MKCTKRGVAAISRMNQQILTLTFQSKTDKPFSTVCVYTIFLNLLKYFWKLIIFLGFLIRSYDNYNNKAMSHIIILFHNIVQETRMAVILLRGYGTEVSRNMRNW